ncbi:energy transducer TonB [Rufibacter roseus]|uniref:Energy transducer TonB n=1 Tax=Rufibacter roseus TaxID=1567108 RepID=A0ABW2DIN5_9BACT|nr:energy transducer TonB [Rufibacter roseus]
MRLSSLLFWTCISFYLLSLGSEVFGQTAPAKCTSTLDSLTNRQVYTQVDSMPSFPGGLSEMFKFISKNIRYPSNTRGCYEGFVVTSFVVEPDGKLTNAKILKSLFEPANLEVLRVLSLMPLWIPGKCQGKAVPTMYVIPVRFAL